MIKHITFNALEGIQYAMAMPSNLFAVTDMMTTPIDEFEIDLLLEIQYNVEADSHVKNVDYTLLEPEEVAEIVHDYVDML